MDETLQGWINLYKPKNISSFFAIKKIQSKFQIKKIGHCGTLDPLAEGILPIAIGKTTKLIPFIIKKEKKYIFQRYMSKVKLKSKFTPKILFFIDDTFDEAEKIEKLLLDEKVLRDLNG